MQTPVIFPPAFEVDDSLETQQELLPLTDSIAQPLSFALASLLTGYPDEHFSGYLEPLLSDPGTQAFASVAQSEAWSALVPRLQALLRSPEGLDGLRSDYIDLFDRGRQSNPLYETEYGRDRAMRKTHELADLAGFYRAFGCDFNVDAAHDMLDHVSIELEFYYLLLMKEALLIEQNQDDGVRIVREGRRKFLEAHLGGFVGSIASRPGVAAHGFYGPLMRWAAALIERESGALGLALRSIGWIDGQQEPEEVCCGSTPAATANA